MNTHADSTPANKKAAAWKADSSRVCQHERVNDRDTEDHLSLSINEHPSKSAESLLHAHNVDKPRQLNMSALWMLTISLTVLVFFYQY